MKVFLCGTLKGTFSAVAPGMPAGQSRTVRISTGKVRIGQPGTRLELT